MGLFGDMLKGARMKDPVRGQAQVVTCTMWHGGSSANCRMQLVVRGEGVPPTSVEHECMVRADRWPTPGITLPVRVDRADPERVKIQWDEVEGSRERGARNAEAMAATMRTGGGTPGGVNVVNLSGGDLSQLSDDQKAKLQMLGIDPAAIAAQQGPTAPPQPHGVDDQLARLTKLGELRDAGVLTPHEFEVQKRRILEG